MEFVFVTLLSFLLFMTMVLMMSSKPEFAARITGFCILITVVGGLFFYGYGFSATEDDLGSAVVYTLLNVCRMFVGDNDYEAICDAPLMEYKWMQMLFWIVHMLALYALGSAAITVLGAKAMRKVRLYLARRGQLHLIYGVNENTLALGRQIQEETGGAVVFIDAVSDPAHAAAVENVGFVFRFDENAVRADAAFARSVGLCRRRKQIHLYALEERGSDNLFYADALLKTMRELGISPDRTNLVLRARESAAVASLQALGERYGYGTVSAIQEADLAARTLVRTFPPCNYVEFADNCKAAEDFEALIIGFDQVGQSVLRQLVMNGQFEGSLFRTAVFSPDCNSVKGFFCKNYPQVTERYDISFHACDARSEQLYDHVTTRGKKLKYIVICIKDEALSIEIAENLTDYLEKLGLDVPVIQCNSRGVRHYNAGDHNDVLIGLYQPHMMSMKRMDKLAMLVNHAYQADESKTPWQHWLDCDYFSRMSCRAMADFIPAMLRMAGVNEVNVAEHGWALNSVQLENLSRTEHLRWCAFHYCMGFSTMSAEEFADRENAYLKQIAEGQKPLAPGKNLRGRTHICLVKWEELDALSVHMSRLTGKELDYKKMDTDNVCLLPKLLKAGRDQNN